MFNYFLEVYKVFVLFFLIFLLLNKNNKHAILPSVNLGLWDLCLIPENSTQFKPIKLGQFRIFSRTMGKGISISSRNTESVY